MQRIDQLYKEWKLLQPLQPEDQRRLDQKFMLEFNYNSNHLEGNTLTYGQTRLLLMFGETSGDAKLRDYEEMKAHNVALELVKREAVDKERPLSESSIRELNRIILVEDFWKNAKTPDEEPTRMQIRVGEYKTKRNSVLTVTGELFEYASPQETPAFMTDLVNWYRSAEEQGEWNPLELAALFHYRYIRIHPFEDGNGRIARLLTNYILLKHGYPMIIVRSADKEQYLSVLHKCDIEVGLTPSDGANASLEKIQPFVEYIKQQMEYALQISIKAAKGESVEEEDDFTKRMMLLEREAKIKNRASYSADNLRNLLELFYKPITCKITEALNPATRFFEIYSLQNLISEELEPNFFSLKIDYLKSQLDDPDGKSMMNNARSLLYECNLNNPKREYHLGNLTIKSSFLVLLEDKQYIIKKEGLKDKHFDYVTYPSEEEIDEIVQAFKKEVQTKIENAIREGK